MDGIVKYKTRNLPNESSNLLNDITEHPVAEFVAKVERGNGSFDVEYNSYLRKGDINVLNGVTEYGFQTDFNMNDGNFLGFGIMPSISTEDSVWLTPFAAFLADTPENLVIKPGREATRVVFVGKTARAFEVDGGEESFSAAKCIFLSAGAIDTPNLLMLSGVGPASFRSLGTAAHVADG